MRLLKKTIPSFYILLVCCTSLRHGTSMASVTYGVNGSLVNTASEEAVRAEVLRLDAIGESNPRATVPGGIRLSWGTQLHPTCIRPEVTEFSREQLARRAEALMARAFRNIASCGERYPELRDPFIRQWVSQARRLVIVCTKVKSTETNLDGITWSAVAPHSLSALRELMQPDERNLLGSLEVEASNRMPAFLFTWDYFRSALDHVNFLGGPFGDETLVHEVFHLTPLNNRYNHNEVAGVRVNAHGACGEDQRMDRVKIVGQLCTGSRAPVERGGFLPAAQVLFQRMGRCGMNRGCVHLFTEEGSSITRNTHYAVDLPVPQAESLCRRIREDGICLQARNATQNGLSPLGVNNTSLVAMEQRLRQRFASVLPHAFNQIPGEFLRLYPDLSQRFLRVERSACFPSFFNRGSDGSWYLTNYAAAQLGIPASALPEDPVRYFNDESHGLGPHLDRLLSSMRSPFLDVPSPAPGCTSEQMLALRDGVSALAAFRRRIGDSWSRLFDPALRRAAGRDEGEDVEFMLGILSSDGDRGNFRQFIGSELLNDYLNALRLHHPRASLFECSQLNIIRSAETASTINQILQEPAPRSCP